MKRNTVVWMLALALLIASSPSAFAGAKIQLGDKGQIDLGFRLQAFAKYSDADLDEDGEFDTLSDFQVRRARFRLTGDVNEWFSMFLQTDVSGNDMQMIDAYIYLHTDPRYQLFIGQHLAPSNRQNLTSSGALLAIDRPGNVYKALTWGTRAMATFDTATYGESDGGFRGPAQVRDTGVTLWGIGDFTETLHYKYYVGTYDGISGPDDDSERYTGRLQFNYGDAEPSFYSTANYLGKKNTISLGVSYDTQADVASPRTPLTDYNYYSVDVFASRGPVTFEAAVMNLDLDGANPFAEGDGWYAQAGYLLPDNKWQPWALIEAFDADDPSGEGSYDLWRVGVSYFIAGHNANIKLGYEMMNADAPIGSSNEDTINSLVLGFFTNY